LGGINPTTPTLLLSVEPRADELVDRIEIARVAYLEQDFDAVEEELSEIFEGLKEAEEEAIRVKDRTFIWIYVIQINVSGTTMICGFILWTLMIRRRFYREVTATRLG
jgi:hypothetical protein